MCIVTIEAAKKMWCPMARVHDLKANPAYNREIRGTVSDGSMCVADECMMFVWDYYDEEKDDGLWHCGFNRLD